MYTHIHKHVARVWPLVCELESWSRSRSVPSPPSERATEFRIGPILEGSDDVAIVRRYQRCLALVPDG